MIKEREETRISKSLDSVAINCIFQKKNKKCHEKKLKRKNLTSVLIHSCILYKALIGITLPIKHLKGCLPNMLESIFV